MGTRSIPNDLPAVDERLVMPACGYEIVGGEVFEVSPAYEPHGSRHSKLSALLEAYAAPGFNAASDMLTRTSKIDDFAPDGSIYPEARDPETGGRQLEQLAFEVVVSESLAHAGRKAAALMRRGVRRVFAIDVDRERGLEWSCETDTWTILGGDAVIDDPALVLPLPIHDLVAAAHADDAVARALLAKRNPVIVAALQSERVEAMAHAILEVLQARGLAPSDATRLAILRLRAPEQLAHALARAAICAHADDVLADSLSPR
jgi:Uma2 family endonuclease